MLSDDFYTAKDQIINCVSENDAKLGEDKFSFPSRFEQILSFFNISIPEFQTQDGEKRGSIHWVCPERCQELYQDKILEPKLFDELVNYEGMFCVLMLYYDRHAICTVILPGDCSFTKTKAECTRLAKLLVAGNSSVVHCDNVRILNLDMIQRPERYGFSLDREFQLQLGQLKAYALDWKEGCGITHPAFQKALDVWNKLDPHIGERLNADAAKASAKLAAGVMC